MTFRLTHENIKAKKFDIFYCIAHVPLFASKKLFFVLFFKIVQHAHKLKNLMHPVYGLEAGEEGSKYVPEVEPRWEGLGTGAEDVLVDGIVLLKKNNYFLFRKPGELAVTAPVYRGVEAHSQVRIQWIV